PHPLPPAPTPSPYTTLFRSRSGCLSAHHIGDDLLSPYRIADADDGGIGHTRVPGDALLDLHGVDVLPSRDDHVVLAAEDSIARRSEEHTSELQSRLALVCRL